MKKKLHSITINEMAKMQVDENNRLFWEGKPVKTEERVKFNWVVNASIILTGVSTFAIAVTEIFNYLNK